MVTPNTDDVFARPSSIYTKASDLKGRAIALQAATPEEVTFSDGESKMMMASRVFTLDDERGKPQLTDCGTVRIYWNRFVRDLGSTPGQWFIGRVTQPQKAMVLEALDDPEFTDVVDELRGRIKSGEV
jgi:hypothetical protein